MDWDDLRCEIEGIFRVQAEGMGQDATMDLHLIEDTPIDGEYVFGEAFPDVNRIWLEVVAPDASSEKITEIICHELVHLKCPDLDHDSEVFTDLISLYLN